MDKVKEVNPDLILLDLYMPQMNGVAVCRLLKEDPETRDIAVIALTAYASDEIMMQCLEAGANEFLAKPVDHARVLSAGKKSSAD
jgi:CheY-like chemotaxis protein